MNQGEMIDRFRMSSFAVLATHGPDGRLDLVPCCFAVIGSTGALQVVSAVDHKPKRHQRLARLDNVNRTPMVSLLVDQRDDDWDKLWWVRLEGRAREVANGPEHSAAVEALAEKYSQYRANPPAGPALLIEPSRWLGWSAQSSDGP